MRMFLLTAAAVLAFASTASAVPAGHVPPPRCLTALCNGVCMPRGILCNRHLPLQCPAGTTICAGKCLTNSVECHQH
jgi:hypothetical protein